MTITDPRQALEAQLRTLLSRQEKIAAHLHGQDGRLEADFGDVSNFTASDEVLEGLDAAALAEIRQVRAALRRIENGTYGQCARCGETIAARRLQALPQTLLCIACAGSAEG